MKIKVKDKEYDLENIHCKKPGNNYEVTIKNKLAAIKVLGDDKLQEVKESMRDYPRLWNGPITVDGAQKGDDENSLLVKSITFVAKEKVIVFN